jgi:hypothetical protein
MIVRFTGPNFFPPEYTMRSILPLSFALSAACSTLDPLDKNPFESDAASEDACASTGIGTPESDGWGAGKVNVDWMVEHHYVTTTAECLSVPQFRLSSTEEGEWPVTFLTFMLASYDNEQWVTKFGDELTVTSTLGDLGVHQSVGTACDVFCGPYWEMDVSEYELAVSPEEDFFIEFQLPGFSDPSDIDELWDEEKDQLAIMAYAGHSWSDTTSTGVEYGSYLSGELLTVNVEFTE